jgi:serine/threonine protein kinase
MICCDMEWNGMSRSPFLVHLYWAFQDDQYLYLVMNFMKGGDLRYYLDKHGPMPEATCRFYVAELLLAVEEMNSLGLVYRDLKPENILLDEDGHLRLSDFGLVYDLKNTQDGMTSGEAGTRGYLSPEVLTGRYGFTQDVWSYGITIYELLHQSVFITSHRIISLFPLNFHITNVICVYSYHLNPVMTYYQVNYDLNVIYHPNVVVCYADY